MSFGGDHPAHGHGKISPRYVPRSCPAMARYRPVRSRAAGRELCPDAFTKGPRTRKTPVRGNISPPCVQIQLVLARYACYVSKGRKAPLGMHRANILPPRGRFRRPKPSDHARRTESCRPPVALPLHGLLPEQLHRGSPFNGFGPCPGVPTQRSADACHLPMPAACRARCNGASPEGRRLRHSTGGPTTKCCAELGLTPEP